MTSLFHLNCITLQQRATARAFALNPYHREYRFRHLQAAQEFQRQISILEVMIMPAKKRAQNNSYGITWVRVDLNAEEKAALLGWIKKGDFDLGELLALCLGEGEKVSFSYSEKQDAFYCTIMGSEYSHRNEGKGFTSYAKNPFDALASAMYKYHTLLEGNMGEADGTGLIDDIG